MTKLQKKSKRTRLMPTPNVVRSLFARSGNRCAFPGCAHELIDQNNTFVAQICHIEAAEQGGPRFNQNMTPEERRHASNLLVLCHRHHKETDNEELFTAEVLWQYKADHEREFGRKNYRIDEAVLTSISRDIEKFWQEVDAINISNRQWETHVLLAEPGLHPKEIFGRVREYLCHLESLTTMLAEIDSEAEDELKKLFNRLAIPEKLIESIPYWENPFNSRHKFEFHSLAIPNTLTSLKMYIFQAEIQLYELHLKLHPDDHTLLALFQRRKREFKEYLKDRSLAD